MKMIIYKIVKNVCKPIFRILYVPKIIGKENIPDNNALIIASNHTSALDSALITITKRTVHFLAKKELFKTKLGNLFFTSVGCISVDRKIHDENAKSEAINALNNNEAIIIFPEGTINRSENVILPFKYGAVSFAKKTNALLLPVAITGKYKLFKKSITIEFGKPYNVTGNIEIENKKLEKIITDMIKRRQNGKE